MYIYIYIIFFAPQQGILTDAGDGEGGIIKKERTISKTIYFYYIIYFVYLYMSYFLYILYILISYINYIHYIYIYEHLSQRVPWHHEARVAGMQQRAPPLVCACDETVKREVFVKVFIKVFLKVFLKVFVKSFAINQ